MFFQIEAAVTDARMQQMLDRFGQQTFVGGKRVPIEKLPRLPEQAATSVYRVKVSLYGARPPVWRRIEIPSAMRLDVVHEVMQVAFDWHGYHLHLSRRSAVSSAHRTTMTTGETGRRGHRRPGPGGCGGRGEDRVYLRLR